MNKIDTLQKLYKHFRSRGDTLSLDILKFLLSWDWNYLLATLPEEKQAEQSMAVQTFIETCKKAKKIILYGAGIGGANFYSVMEKLGIEVVGFIDTYKTGTYMNKPIISLLDYKRDYNGTLICIAVGDKYAGEIKALLADNQITNYVYSSGNAYDKDSIFHSSFYTMANYAPLDEAIRLKAQSGEPQYFSLPELPHKENEIFVDCGCFNGENIRDFLKWNNGRGRIIAFEPDEFNFERCTNYLKDVPNCKILKYGIGDKAMMARFNAGQDSSSHLSPDGNSEIQIVTLDQELEGIPVTFIKMDIEGGELSALKGSKEIIRKFSPKLAICVYHKASDIWEIPEFIWSINSNYDFYLRHYEDSYPETVLYGVPLN